jgi:hypothetical protein
MYTSVLEGLKGVNLLYYLSMFSSLLVQPFYSHHPPGQRLHFYDESAHWWDTSWARPLEKKNKLIFSIIAYQEINMPANLVLGPSKATKRCIFLNTSSFFIVFLHVFVFSLIHYRKLLTVWSTMPQKIEILQNITCWHL